MIRTRVAPSPTGDPHLGTAFVAIMNKLYAEKMVGKFILRIEDTDKVRSTKSSELSILDSLKWLGVNWDEGPDIGGEYGPYRQSDRIDIYKHYANILLEKGAAFRCFCSSESLTAQRNDQIKNNLPQKYDGRCSHISKDESDSRAASGEPHTIRMKVPESGICDFKDELRGDLSIGWNEVDMQILIKSDGWPTYHLANVVDDHLMQITDVIRGEEWISSTPKHIALYDAFGWNIPRFHHLPLLRNPDRSKLSKRRNPTSITYYKNMGYSSKTMFAFLAAFAVRGIEDVELIDYNKLYNGFSLDNLYIAGPVFDLAKLDWLQGQMVRSMDSNSFYDEFKSFVTDDKIKAMLALAQSRITKMSDIIPMSSFLFSGMIPLIVDQLLDGKVSKEKLSNVFALLHYGLSNADWNVEDIEAVLKKVATIEEVKFKDMVRHVYIAITGQPTSLPLYQSIELLGKDIVLARLNNAKSLLPQLSKSDQSDLIGKWDSDKVDNPI